MPKIPIVKARDFCDFLVKYGCAEISVKGSHHKIYNPQTRKTSVIAIHSGKDLDRGTFSGVLRQLGIDIGEFVKYLENN